MYEKIFASVMVACCAVFLAREAIGERRRYKLDAAVRRAWSACRRVATRLVRSRASRTDAERVAQDVIRRAQNKVKRDGNVYRPESFRGPDDSSGGKPH